MCQYNFALGNDKSRDNLFFLNVSSAPLIATLVCCGESLCNSGCAMTASLLLGGAILLAITVSGVLFSYFSSPRNGVGGIPTIPFWVALMPLVKDVDQQDVFTKYIEKPLRKHGAASIFFAGQCNVLIHKPAYLAEVFRREDIYQKSGNYSKIPHSVLAALLGDNIISSRGETWKKYKRVIKPGLQARPNLEVLLQNARQLSTILVESLAVPTDGIQGSIQRNTIACFGNMYFNVDLNVGEWKRVGPYSKTEQVLANAKLCSRRRAQAAPACIGSRPRSPRKSLHLSL